MGELIGILILLGFLSACNRKYVNKLIGGDPTGPTGPTTNDEIVIVVAGQSNGVSPTDNNPIAPAAPPAWSRTGKVKVTHDIGGEHVDGVPTENNPIKFSAAWVYLGDRIASWTGRRVHIINSSHGNTSTRNWVQYIPDFESKIKQYNPDVVLWIQGESDTSENVPQDESYPILKEIMDVAHDGKDRPVYVALDSGAHSWDYDEALSMPIRRTEEKIISEGRALRGPDLDQMRVQHPDWFEYVSHNQSPGAEFVGDGIVNHANAWFEILRPTLPMAVPGTPRAQ